MKTVTCDFCNEEIKQGLGRWLKAILKPANGVPIDQYIAALCGTDDICPKCAKRLHYWIKALKTITDKSGLMAYHDAYNQMVRHMIESLSKEVLEQIAVYINDIVKEP